MQDQTTPGGNVTQLHPRNRSALTESLLSHRERQRPTVDLSLLAELFREHHIADCSQDDEKGIVAMYWSWLESNAPEVLDEVQPLILIESLAKSGKPLEEAKQPSAAMVAIARIWREKYCPQHLFIESGDDVPSRFMEFLRKRRPGQNVGTTAQRITAIITAELQLIQKDREKKW